MNKIIVCLSGGKASAYCANWTFQNFPKENIILYFNDTKWEHPDLYRFLNDLENYFQHKIFSDNDGRSPEQVFYDKHALANNRMPFCSRILKANRLQKFYKNGDTIIFGIGKDELNRAERLVSIYQVIAAKTKKYPKLIFPLIQEKTTKEKIDEFLKNIHIEQPVLYKLGFFHNNCFSGDTLFLTEDGWCSFKDSVGKTVTVLGTRSKWVKGKIKRFGKQPLLSVSVKRHGYEKIIKATPNHIWFVWCGNRCKTYSKKRTDELKSGDRLVTQYPKGLRKNIPYSTWGIAHGFVFGDGTVAISKKGWITPAWVRLCGIKDRDMFKYFNNSPYREIEKDIIISGLPRSFKNYPDINESKAYLAGWLSGYFAADGSISQDGSTVTLSSANKEHLKFTKNVANRIGIATGDIRKQLRKGYLKKEGYIYRLSFFRHSLDERFFLLENHRNRFLNRQNIEAQKFLKQHSQGHRAMVSWVVDNVSITGEINEVYCAIVPSCNAFTIDGNILTHNCSGGCIRSGKKQWKLLLEKLPEVYFDRERVEKEVSSYFKRKCSYLKDETLEELRIRINSQLCLNFDENDSDQATECIGICDILN